MPMSWEIKEANSVLVVILHVDIVPTAWAFGLRNIIIPGRDDLRRFNPFYPTAGMPFDMARNTGCQAALQYGAEWCIHLDSDVIPPRDFIPRLIAHKKPIMSGVYHRRSPPYGLPVMMKPLGQWVQQYPANSVIEVDVVGAGCLAIHRSVLEALPQYQRPGKPWFDWRVDLRGAEGWPHEECLSEDFTMCRAIKQKLGIPILVDTSIQCRHAGLAQATYGKMEPLICETAT